MGIRSKPHGAPRYSDGNAGAFVIPAVHTVARHLLSRGPAIYDPRDRGSAATRLAELYAASSPLQEKHMLGMMPFDSLSLVKR